VFEVVAIPEDEPSKNSPKTTLKKRDNEDKAIEAKPKDATLNLYLS
jgi:hypothetical protein